MFLSLDSYAFAWFLPSRQSACPSRLHRTAGGINRGTTRGYSVWNLPPAAMMRSTVGHAYMERFPVVNDAMHAKSHNRPAIMARSPSNVQSIPVNRSFNSCGTFSGLMVPILSLNSRTIPPYPPAGNRQRAGWRDGHALLYSCTNRITATHSFAWSSRGAARNTRNASTNCSMITNRFIVPTSFPRFTWSA
jgi:hypothetical protein